MYNKIPTETRQHGAIYMYNKRPQRLDTASTWLQHGAIYMYNKRATETRHCIHMLGYSMVQYTCTTKGPQRLDTASTCWATAWYNIHVQ